MPRPIFYKVMRRLLEERLEQVRGGTTPTETDIRHFFYEIRNKFLRENPQFDKIDINAKDPYTSFGINLKDWFVNHAKELGHDPSTWWRVREALNIWAEGRALADGECGKFLVDRDTRNQVQKNCSFILVCEKKTVSRQLLEELRKASYKMNLISSAGYSPADLQEAVMAIAAELDADEPTFYILVLHDYDLDGLEILFNLRERYANVIDVGVNGEFLDYLKKSLGYDARILEEKSINKKFEAKLKGWVEESDGYSQGDFEFLQGEKTGEKRWLGRRIEIDAIHVEHGIEPFVKYILQKIEDECQVWDLSRIGVEPFKLKFAGGRYADATHDFNSNLRRLYDAADEQIEAPLHEIQKVVNDEVSSCLEWGYFCDLRERVEKRVERELKKIKKRYPDFERDFAKNYAGDLEKVNERIERYEGDVRQGHDDLKKEVDDLQDSADEDMENDPKLKKYKLELGRIDTKEDELRELPEPDRDEVIRAVIKRLKGMLT